MESSRIIADACEDGNSGSDIRIPLVEICHMFFAIIGVIIIERELGREKKRTGYATNLALQLSATYKKTY